MRSPKRLNAGTSSAQASMEYVMIAGFIALVIIPTTFLFYSYASNSAEEIDRAQVDKFGRDVVSIAETVYYLGPPSRIVVEERLPKNVHNISIEQDPVTSTYLLEIFVDNAGIISTFSFPTKVKIAGSFGADDITAGIKTVRIEAKAVEGEKPFASISFRAPGKVFLTSTTYNGNLGGLAGADAKCQARAQAAGLTGTWKAWLSAIDGDARDRITNHEYVRTDGALVAINLDDLTDGTIANPINIDENGNKVTSNPFPWTATKSSGVLKTASATCDSSSWTSMAGLGWIGAADYTDGMWTETALASACGTTKRLYCFEQ